MSSPQYNRPASTADAAAAAAERVRFIDAAADRCVKCALCLPVCPTWNLTRDETESPRGRIALLQGVARNVIDADTARPHIDRCLNCMACQNVCPANVPYAQLVDAGQAMLRERGASPDRATRMAARVLETPVALRALAGAYRVARHVPGLAAVNKTLARVLPMPDAGNAAAALPPVARSGERGVVVVLSGCVTDAFERQTTHALGVVLNAAGYGVREVAGCCGALSRHSGDAGRATALAQALTERIAAIAPDAIVHPATGCAAVLTDVAHYIDSDAARRVADRLVDVGDWLERSGLAQQLSQAPPVTLRVALHAPCTQRNVIGGASATRALIDALPGVTCVSLAATSCCGAAGSNMLSEPDAADDLAARTLAPLDAAEPVDVLLTPNVGCAWHLRGFTARRRRPLRVMHPVVFLALRLHGANALV